MKEEASRAKGARKTLIWTGVTAGVFVVLVLALYAVVFSYERSYENRIFSGVQVLGVRLDGLTKVEASQAVESVADSSLAKGLQFSYRGEDVTLDVTSVSVDPDASHELVRYDIDQAVDRAFTLGRESNAASRFLTQLRMRFAPIRIMPAVAIDRGAIEGHLRSALASTLQTPANASFSITTTSSPATVEIVPERKGTVLETGSIFSELHAQLVQLDFRPIVLADKLVEPSVTAVDLEPLKPSVEAFLQRPSLTFTADDKRFAIPSSTLAGWISVTGTRGDLTVALDPVAFATGIKTIAASVEQEGKNGELVVKDGKIDSFIAGSDGVVIDTDATYQEVLAGWPTSSTFPLITKVTPGKLIGEDPEKLGIQELLGTGKSNFSGSPSNRRKNIAHGAALVNGTIIQPGETFSLLRTLGEIDGAHNWLPELVIKGNETKPEFGGGLCQIGTTTFRGALASGLPIVERQNHSYRVRYYEPAGTDATIYDPKPDFRFLNDTNHAILIHAYIKGDDAIFEFWGTKDGRAIVQTKPKVSNIVSPPPMKLVETLDLPVGKKKCTETAHAGADASFDYTVTYETGDVKSETFRSHYKPWQAVCLVGAEKLSASSTAAELP